MHTPGPWRTTEQDEDIARYVVSENNVLIADCYADTHLDFGLPEEKEYRANARLIAATPKLLKAAKKILEDWDKRNLTVAIQGLAIAVEDAER